MLSQGRAKSLKASCYQPLKKFPHVVFSILLSSRKKLISISRTFFLFTGLLNKGESCDSVAEDDEMD